MKTICSKLLLILFLVPFVGFSANDPLTGKFTKTKKLNKSYSVNSNANLLVDNSYGNIKITSWNQNNIEIEVIIKTNGNDEEKVIAALKAIDVEFSGSAASVSAKTVIEEKNSSWWNVFSSNSNINREINYIIKMPVTNSADLSNDYGSINIDRLKGNTKINCDYGKLIIGELLGTQNEINFDYTKNSSIGYVKNAKINADYSGFEIDEAGAVELNADYTSSKIGKVTSMKFNCDYGSVSVDKVQQLIGNGDYLNTKIGEVHGSLVLNLDYGSTSIEKLSANTTSVKINSDYTGIKIGYDARLPFSFVANISYGSVKGLEGLEITEAGKKSVTGNYAGYNIKNNSGTDVIINSSYGSINFNRK